MACCRPRILSILSTNCAGVCVCFWWSHAGLFTELIRCIFIIAQWYNVVTPTSFCHQHVTFPQEGGKKAMIVDDKTLLIVSTRVWQFLINLFFFCFFLSSVYGVVWRWTTCLPNHLAQQEAQVSFFPFAVTTFFIQNKLDVKLMATGAAAHWLRVRVVSNRSNKSVLYPSTYVPTYLFPAFLSHNSTRLHLIDMMIDRNKQLVRGLMFDEWGNRNW